MGIEIEEKDELQITADILANVPDKYQKNVGYFIWDFARSISSVISTLWTNLKCITAFFDIEKLEYDDLVRFVFQRRGIVAHTATKATGYLTVTCNVDVTVNIGDTFCTADNLIFKSLETKTLQNGDAFKVECTEFGTIGNVPAETITMVLSSDKNIVSVKNESPFDTGFEAETKESIIDRYYEDLRLPASCGNVYHYQAWAKSVNGIGKVKVKPLWNGANTVKVIVIDSNNRPVNAEIVQNIQDYIDPYVIVDDVKTGWGCGNGQAPIGAYCTVESAKALNIDVSAYLICQNTYEIDTVKENVRQAIDEYILSLAFVEGAYVSFQRIGSAIINAEGVADYSNLLVNGGTDNVEIVDNSVESYVAVLNNANFVTIDDTEENENAENEEVVDNEP